jgi:hypothetical protein
MLKTAAPSRAQEKKDVDKQLHPIGPNINAVAKLLHPTGPNKSKIRNIYIIRQLFCTSSSAKMVTFENNPQEGNQENTTDLYNNLNRNSNYKRLIFAFRKSTQLLQSSCKTPYPYYRGKNDILYKCCWHPVMAADFTPTMQN